MNKEQERKLFANLAVNIKKYRAVKGLTQEQLAEAADLSQQYVCLIEKAKVSPSVLVVCKIAEAFDITVNDLICEP